MKLSTITATFLFALLISLSSCHKKKGCTDTTATNYDPSAEKNCCCAYKKKGSLLFWTNDPFLLTFCGVLTIRLSNGQQTNVTGYYFSAPANCINQFGGYFYLEEGTYTYQVTGNASCTIRGGTVTVIGDRCNFARLD